MRWRSRSPLRRRHPRQSDYVLVSSVCGGRGGAPLAVLGAVRGVGRAHHGATYRPARLGHGLGPLPAPFQGGQPMPPCTAAWAGSVESHRLAHGPRPVRLHWQLQARDLVMSQPVGDACTLAHASIRSGCAPAGITTGWWRFRKFHGRAGSQGSTGAGAASHGGSGAGRRGCVFASGRRGCVLHGDPSCCYLETTALGAPAGPYIY